MDLNLGFDTVCQALRGSGPGERGCGGGGVTTASVAERGGNAPPNTHFCGGGGGALRFRMRVIRGITQKG